MTDDELIKVLDDEGRPWIVRVGGGGVISRDSLRLALESAWSQSAYSAPVTQLARLPDDDVIIEAPQLLRLWERLGWMGN